MGKSRPSVKGTNPFERKNVSLSDLTDGMFPEKEAEAEPQVVERVVERIVEVEVIPENALVPNEAHDLVTKGFRISKTSLIMDEGSTYEDWLRLGPTITHLGEAAQWALADWILMGEDVFDQSYEAIAQWVGKKKKTIQNYLWVARNMPVSLRKENLTFGHHNLVAGLDSDDLKTQWLDAAEQNDWSVAEMRDAMSAIERGAVEEAPDGEIPGKDKLSPIEKLTLRTSKDRDSALKLARHKSEDVRTQLRSLADEQMEWWRIFRESLNL